MNNKDKYIVIATCSDGDVIISKDGNKHFTLEQAQQVILEHTNIGADINIYQLIE